MKNLFLSIIIISSYQAYPKCIPARVEIDLPDTMDYTGQYHRIHPSGDYIIASSPGDGRMGNASIIDLTNRDDSGKIIAREIETQMKNETYPVEGSWKLISSPYDGKGMEYYDFDMIKSKKNAKEVDSAFHDAEHDEYYHSSAELTPYNKSKGTMSFRTVLWKGSRYRDYSVKFDKDGNYQSHEVIKKDHRLCNNVTSNLESPIISKDGTEIASQHSGTSQVYKINKDGTCDLVNDLGYSTSKVNFSYPKPNSKGALTFTASGYYIDSSNEYGRAVHYYDRDTKKTKRISSAKDERPRYPGFTEDGRVIFIDTSDEAFRVVIVDPNQLDANGEVISNPSKCIQEAGTGSSKSKSTGSKTISQ